MIEFSTIFIVVPLLYFFRLLPNNSMIPLLWGIFVYTLIILKTNRICCCRWDIKPAMLLPLCWRASAVCLCLTLFTWRQMPDNFLAFVRSNPTLWLAVMLLYPILSAFTQEMIFRKFFFFRYRPLFRHDGWLIALSAVSFAYMHLVFRNPVAVCFTLIGGLIFAVVYQRSRSLMLVTLEHAIYGNAVFTVGLGYYFYHGAA
ncbi:hypothetical protein OA57_04580 [Chelonobacter oris]|uniref:CAAX prenyl protease 2/Lysostaphin resistance protein A-like domain-containing protein n=1 Tax=Chelonobacter oris TaxID=505317 RepID=A0A0A3AN05_9PAST|nr:hypothetical protein OA57_04580 [Chelonobacter oris]